jgi:hypothetical protein
MLKDLCKLDNCIIKRILSAIPRLEDDLLNHGTSLGNKYDFIGCTK